MKTFLKKIIPESALLAYHHALSTVAAWYYGEPSLKMVVIGVTGTNGKSTTSNLIAHVLEADGRRVGVTTTVNFRIAGREWLNDTKMTMLGRSRLQRLLAEMVRERCGFAVVETSSEGIKQGRHADIAYDVAVFTNLTPEHLEAHGGFENYKAAKGQLFAKLSRDPRKTIAKQTVPKVIVANLDSPHAGYFLSFPADRRIGFTRDGVDAPSGVERVAADNLQVGPGGSTFTVDGVPFTTHLPGAFNVDNALAAIAVGLSQAVPLEVAAEGLAGVAGVPGRMEFIEAGQDFKVLVDYAPEPESVRQLYEAVGLFPHKRIIHVLGSCGGGRDRDRRPILGQLAAEHADIVFVTNEDPYDDDPQQIINEVAAGALALGKREGQDLFLVPDRAEALNRAVAMAEAGDLLIATGKGAEQAICVARGRKIPWDERTQLREAIEKRLAREAGNK